MFDAEFPHRETTNTLKAIARMFRCLVFGHRNSVWKFSPVKTTVHSDCTRCGMKLSRKKTQQQAKPHGLSIYNGE